MKIDCTFNASNYTFDFDFTKKLFKNTFSYPINITIKIISGPNNSEFKNLQFRIIEAEPCTWVIRSNHEKYNFISESNLKLEDLIRYQLKNFLDLLIASALFTPLESYLIVDTLNSAQKYCIIGMNFNYKANEWRAYFITREKLDINHYYNEFISEYDDYFHIKSTSLKLLFIIFSNEIEGYDPFRIFITDTEKCRTINKRLNIKVPPISHWFTIFPINAFSRYGFGGFKQFKSIDWDITEKSLYQNNLEKNELLNEINDIYSVISNCLIIINSYPFFYLDNLSAELCRAAISIFQQIKLLLTNICFQGRDSISLRLYFNPDNSTVLKELSEKNTRYFFADFHSEGTRWICGYDLEPQGYIETNEFLPGSFKHIRLMRVFHCTSINNPFAQNKNDSIVNNLLKASVHRVEGSMTQEDFLDFACSMFHMFFGSDELNFILKMKAKTISIDLSELLNKTNNFLIKCNWEKIKERSLA